VGRQVCVTVCQRCAQCAPTLLLLLGNPALPPPLPPVPTPQQRPVGVFWSVSQPVRSASQQCALSSIILTKMQGARTRWREAISVYMASTAALRVVSRYSCWVGVVWMGVGVRQQKEQTKGQAHRCWQSRHCW
jgi:hypothetical protein